MRPASYLLRVACGYLASALCIDNKNSMSISTQLCTDLQSAIWYCRLSTSERRALSLCMCASGCTLIIDTFVVLPVCINIFSVTFAAAGNLKLFGEHFAEWHPPSTHDHHGVDAQRKCCTRAATDASRQQPTLTPLLDGQWHTAQWRSQQWAPQQCRPWCARCDPYSRRQRLGRAPVAGRAADSRQRGGIPLPSPRQHLPRRLGGWEDN